MLSGGPVTFTLQNVDVGWCPKGIVSADFDGDDLADLAVVNSANDDVSILYGQDGGGFAGREDFDVGDNPWGIVSDDFNGDERPDLAVTNNYADSVSILYGQDGGGFADREDFDVGDHPRCSVMVSDDFNGDNLLDLAVTNQYDDDVSVLYGQEGGGFGDRLDIPVGDYPYNLVSGDFNGDDLPDLAVTNWGDDDVSVLYGQDDGGFGDRLDVAVGDAPYAIVSGDFDGDDRLDLAVTNRFDDDVSILYGQDDGSFGDRLDVPVGGRPHGLVSADINGDGLPDLAVANYMDADVSVLYGQDDGSFGDRHDVTVGDHPWAIVAGHFNDDGGLDLAVTNYHDDNVSILYGPADNQAPRVTSVLVSSTSWDASFLDHLEAQGLGSGGYAVPTASGELTPLPWINLDQVKIVFSEAVTVAEGDLTIHGINVPDYTPASGPDGSLTNTATYTLSTPIAADKLLLVLSDNVTDAAGHQLDGEWTGTFPSGNGTEGGDFLFRLNVLPGDADQSGQVRTPDWRASRAQLGAAPGDAGYSIFLDVDGSGIIRTPDWRSARSRLGDELPAGEPATPLGSGAIMASLGGPAGNDDLGLLAASLQSPAQSPQTGTGDPARSPMVTVALPQVDVGKSVTAEPLVPAIGPAGAAPIFVGTASADAPRDAGGLDEGDLPIDLLLGLKPLDVVEWDVL